VCSVVCLSWHAPSRMMATGYGRCKKWLGRRSLQDLPGARAECSEDMVADEIDEEQGRGNTADELKGKPLTVEIE
jgi:hypothetical protein